MTWQSEGEITLLGGRQPSGGVYGRAPMHFNTDPSGLVSGYGSPQHFHYPMVSGELANGRDVVLVDARLRVWEPDRNGGFSMSGPNARFAAWAALIGHGIPRTSDVQVDSGVIQLSHLDAFVARPPIDETQYPLELYEDDDPSFRMKFRQDSCQTWSDADAEVEVEYRISAGVHGGYHFHVTFSPTVRVTLKTPVPIKDFFTSWVVPLHGLVSAATGENEDITYWSCSPLVKGNDLPPARRQFEVFVNGVTQEPYASENTIPDKHVSAIRLGDGESLLSLLRRWQAIEREQNPILNTYDVQSLGPDQTPRARFLLLVQALEGLCGHEDRLSGRWDRFALKRERILNECRDVLSSKDFKFLNRWVPSTPYNLEDALTEMLEVLPVNLMPELTESALVKTVISEVDSITTTVGALRHVRNQLSHGTETFDPHDLHVAASVLARAVRGHLLRLLDASAPAQERVLSPTRR